MAIMPQTIRPRAAVLSQPAGGVRAPGREMPASEEAEQHVIACCLLDGNDTIARCLEAGIAQDSFFWPGNQVLFQTIIELYQKGQPVTLEVLAEELSTRRLLEQAGGYAHLMQVTGKVPTTAHARYFIEVVREHHARRELIKRATSLIEQSYQGANLKDLTQAAESLTSSVAPIALDRSSQLARLNSRRVSATAKPPEPVVRLYLAEKPICTPGNITTLTSKAKTGKTATTGAATAAIIAAASGTAATSDTFRFRASNPQGHAVIIVDTEQSPFDAWLCYERALLRAGNPAEPKWLYHYSLVGYSPRQLQDSLDLAIAEAIKKHGGIFAIILDGVADFVASVNDEAESNGFVNWLRERTVSHDCPAICVIHSNEGEKSGDDGRGHLGKQLIRKAESNLLLKKDGEVTAITSDKQRKAPITAQDGVAFRWSSEHNRHVSCDTVEKKPGGRPAAHSIRDFWDCIPEKTAPHESGTIIHRRANTLHETKANTFKSMLEQAWKDGLLEREYTQRSGYAYRRSV